MKVPLLFELGGTKLKDASPNVFTGTEKLVKTVVIRFMVNNAEIVPDKKLVVLA